MCMMCNGASRDEVRFHLHGTISRHGWAIFGVGDHETTGWLYTIGLVAGFNHPELVVVGQEPALAAAVLNHLGERVRRGERFDVADRTAVGDESEVGLRHVHPVQIELGLLNAWVDYYGALGPPYPEPQALQVVLSDGRYCHQHQQAQPLLDGPTDVLPIRPPNRAARRALQRRRLHRI
jgi:hypothetical protein